MLGSVENQLEGTADWTLLSHSFRMTELNQVDLCAELRAHAGEVEFDLASMNWCASREVAAPVRQGNLIASDPPYLLGLSSASLPWRLPRQAANIISGRSASSEALERPHEPSRRQLPAQSSVARSSGKKDKLAVLFIGCDRLPHLHQERDSSVIVFFSMAGITLQRRKR
jgi:hypothetical protein